MSETTKTVTTSVLYEGSTKALNNKGEEITLYVGEWRGQGGWSQPAWSEYPENRINLQDLIDIMPHLSTTGYGWKLIPETFRIRRVTTVTTVEKTYEEV